MAVDPGTAYIAASGVSLAGGMYAANMNAQQNQYNLNFQQAMAHHGVQWRYEDMKRAGLNPILAVNPGGGAQASGGSNIPVQNPAGGINSAVAAQIAKIKAETTTEEQKAINIGQDTKIKEEEVNKNRAEQLLIQANVQLTNAKTYGQLSDNVRKALIATVMDKAGELIVPLEYAVKLLPVFGAGTIGYRMLKNALTKAGGFKGMATKAMKSLNKLGTKKSRPKEKGKNHYIYENENFKR